MKYKLWVSLLFLCAIALSLVTPILENGVSSKRYHQHLEAKEKDKETKGNGFATHLPLVKIETGGTEIPGRAVEHEDGTYSYTTTSDGSELISAYMDIVDHEFEYNHPGDEPSLSSKITIHVRGNSSRSFDKLSYAIRLVTEDGLNNPQTVMGMDAHHE